MEVVAIVAVVGLAVGVLSLVWLLFQLLTMMDVERRRLDARERLYVAAAQVGMPAAVHQARKAVDWEFLDGPEDSRRVDDRRADEPIPEGL